MSPQPARSRVLPPPRRRTSPALVVGLVVAAIAVIAILAVVLVALGGDDDAPDDLAPQTRPVAVSGDPLPAYAGQPDAASGAPAPELQGEDFAGRPVAITHDGRPKAIALVAHWCPHCQAEVPRLADFLETDGMPEGVDLYIVPTGTSTELPNYPPQTWLEREGLGDVPTLVDSEDAAAMTAMGGPSYPYWVFLDADGNVAGRVTGELPMGAFAAWVDDLAAGRPLDMTGETGGSSGA